jgi:hypothetical protein
MSPLIWLKTIIVYSYPVIALIGLTANCLSFLIFSRKIFKNTVFIIYFRFYVVFQIINLVMPINKMLELNLDIFLSRISSFACKLRYFYGNLNYSICSWLLVAISLDRYLSISYPSKFALRKKPLFQVSLCCFVIGLSIFFNISYWFYYSEESSWKNQTNQTNQTKRIDKCVSHSILIDLVKFVQQYLCPFLFMSSFTFLTAKNLYQSRRKVNSKITNSSSKTMSNDRKFTIISVFINVLFLLFNLPYYLLYMIDKYSSLFENLKDLHKLIESITYLLLYINLAITFLINYFINSMFKKETEILLERLKF